MEDVRDHNGELIARSYILYAWTSSEDILLRPARKLPRMGNPECIADTADRIES